MINCIIVNEDLFTISEISTYLQSFAKVHLLKSFTNPMEACAFIKTLPDPLDLLISNIEMPVMSGIELVTITRKKINRVIFTSSNSQYAINAFEVLADGFLLKPFSLSQFATVIEKVLPDLDQKKPISQELLKPEQDFIFIKSKNDSGKLIKVLVNEIVAIESLLNYVQIHTLKSKITTHITLKEIRSIFSHRKSFRQFHRSFIIAENHITSIDGNVLIMSTGSKFAIGNKYKEELYRFFDDKLLKPA